MKIWIACAAAFLALSACGSSKEAKEALASMNLEETGSGLIKWDSQSGSGSKAVFKNVRIKLADQDDAPRILVDEMTFDGLAMGDDHAVFKSLTLTGVEPDLPEEMGKGVEVRVERIVLANPNEEMAETVSQLFEYLTDPEDSPPPSGDNYQDWTFGQLLVSGTSAEFPINEAGTSGKMTIKVGEVAMNDARDLDPEAMSFGRFHVTGASLKAEDFKSDQGEGFRGAVEIGLGEFSVTDLQGLTAQKQEVGSILVSNLTAKVDGATNEGALRGDAKLGELSLTGLKSFNADRQEFGQFKLAGVSFKVDGGVEAGKVAADASIGEISLAGFKHLTPGEIEFGKFLMSGIAGKASVDGPDMRGSFGFGLGEFSGENVTKSRVGKVVLSGLKADFDVPDDAYDAPANSRLTGKFDFGAMAIGNLDLGYYVGLIQAESTGADEDTGGNPRLATFYSRQSSPLEAGYDSFTWSGVSMEFGGIKVAGGPLNSSIERSPQGAVTRAAFPRASFALTVDPAASRYAKTVADELAKVGLSKAELHMSSEAAYEPASDLLRIPSANIGSDGLAELNLSGRAAGFNKGYVALIANPSDFAGMDAMKVVGLDVSIVDKALVDLIFRYAAQSASEPTTPQALRANAVKQVRDMRNDMVSAGMDAAVARELANAMGDFLERPGALRIKVEPPQPVGLGSLLQGKLPKAQMGFSAIFTPAAAAPAPR